LPQISADEHSAAEPQPKRNTYHGGAEKIKSNSEQSAKPSIQRTHRTSEDAESGRKKEYEY
jgi:hypothetical protein